MAGEVVPGCIVRTEHLGYYVDGSYGDVRLLVHKAIEAGEPLELVTVSLEGHVFVFEVLEPVVAIEELPPERWQWVLEVEMQNRARAGVHEDALAGMRQMADALAKEVGGGDEEDPG